MPRRFIVEAEASRRGADLVQALAEPMPGERRHGGDAMGSRPGIRGLQRVQGERVLEVREQQLLVLLLVVHAKLDPGEQRRIDGG